VQQQEDRKKKREEKQRLKLIEAEKKKAAAEKSREEEKTMAEFAAKNIGDINETMMGDQWANPSDDEGSEEGANKTLLRRIPYKFGGMNEDFEESITISDEPDQRLLCRLRQGGRR
jgi:hypothetical protein